MPIELNVRKGDHIVGILEEEDDQDFDWFIVDEENLVWLKNGYDFEEVAGMDHVTADRIDWEVDSKDPWFLVFRLPHRQYARSIKVKLRHQRDS